MFRAYMWPWLGPPLITMQHALCTSGFVDDVMFSHNGADSDTDYWQIIHRDLPGSAGVEVCYRLLPCLHLTLLFTRV